MLKVKPEREIIGLIFCLVVVFRRVKMSSALIYPAVKNVETLGLKV